MVALAAMAARTERVTLGTLLTPLPWRRPWKVASQAATVDELSGGRAVVTVGLGAVVTGLPSTGEELNRRTRAEMMDEGIDLMRELWAGRQEYHGRHYDYVCERPDLVEALRQPRAHIPVWVVGAWPRPRSLRRVLRCDGLVPEYDDTEQAGLDTMREIRAWLDSHADHPIDLISEGETPADDPAAAVGRVRQWATAGATWWLETRWEMPHHSAERMAEVRERIVAGPPTP